MKRWSLTVRVMAGVFRRQPDSCHTVKPKQKCVSFRRHDRPNHLPAQPPPEGRRERLMIGRSAPDAVALAEAHADALAIVDPVHGWERGKKAERKSE